MANENPTRVVQMFTCPMCGNIAGRAALTVACDYDIKLGEASSGFIRPCTHDALWHVFINGEGGNMGYTLGNYCEKHLSDAISRARMLTRGFEVRLIRVK